MADLSDEDFNSMMEGKSSLGKKEFPVNEKGVRDAATMRDMMLQAMASAFAKEVGIPADRTRLVQEVDPKNNKIYLYFEEK